MPNIVISNTPYYVNSRDKTSNPKINGKYVTNAPYRHLVCVAPKMRILANQTGYGDLYNAMSGNWHGTPASVATTNRLYSKLKEELTGPKGELLTSTLEWKSSLDMISGRAIQLAQAYSALRKGKFKRTADILRMEVPSGIAKRAKRGQSAASMWLEYWMGWAPLAGDIGLAIEVLTKESRPPRSFSVAVTQSIEDRKYVHNVTDKVNGIYYKDLQTLSEKGSFSAYGKVSVINHNAHLADQLGFTNPALTAWQMLPFSFMVDWFANVGQVLGSLTDFMGLDITQTGTAASIRASGSRYIVENVLEYYSAYPGQWPRSSRVVMKNDIKAEFHTVHVWRTPGTLPTPRLQVVMLDRLSLTRAATSVSLLYEIFLRK